MRNVTVKTLIVFAMGWSLSGCASWGGPPPLDPNYSMYIASVRPLLDLKITPDGKIGQITLNQAPQPYVRQPNEWVRVLEKLVGAAGIFGAIWASGQALSDIVDNAGKNAGTVVTGSQGAFVGNTTGGEGTFGSPPTTYLDSFNETTVPATPVP